jgi:hypothetical protein
MSLSVLLALHEVLHLRVHPRRGWHRDSILGVLSRQGMLYACYPGEMSRNARWCALLPFAALTVLPWPVCLWSREFSFAGRRFLHQPHRRRGRFAGRVLVVAAQ